MDSPLNGLNTIDWKKPAFVLAGLVIGASAVFLYMNMGQVSAQQAGEDLATLLSDQTGQNYEFVSAQGENGMYRVDLRSPQNQLITYYVSKTGSLYSNQVTSTEGMRQTIDFRNCLANKNTVMYGNISQQATQAQIQALGGTSMVTQFYRDINNPQVLQQAVNNGVQQVPAFYYNNQTLAGPVSAGQVANFTGCSIQ